MRPRLAPWQTAALGSKSDVDEDKLFEEATLGRFERKSAPHLQTNVRVQPASVEPEAAPPTERVDAEPLPVVSEEVADLEVDLALGEGETDDIDDDAERALARRASKLLERGDLSPDDPEVIHLLEVVNSTGLRARPGELVNLNNLSPVQRRRLIIRVLCGLVAEVPTDDSSADLGAEVEPATEAASA